MIEKEIDGVTYYCFEPSEEEARKQFERAMIAEETVTSMFQALLEAMAEMERRKREAWRAIQQEMPEEYLEDTLNTYNWVRQGFPVKKK